MPEVIRKMLMLGAGISMIQTLDFFFDYVLYPIALISLGIVWGGIVMTIFSVILNVLLIQVYDWTKQDWLQIEVLKKQRDEVLLEGSWGRKTIGKILRSANIPAFFILSYKDPLLATLYLRHGSHQYNGMRGRDWGIFFASTVISNLIWTVGMAGAIEIVSYISKRVS